MNETEKMPDFALLKARVKMLKEADRKGASLSPIDFETIDMFDFCTQQAEKIEILEANARVDKSILEIKNITISAQLETINKLIEEIKQLKVDN